MQKTVAERAIESLHDYAIWLRDRGDLSDSLARTREERADSPTKPECPQRTRKLKALEDAAATWEKNRLRWWRARGRLTTDGTLRVPDGPAPRWTLTKIERAFPDLNVWDRWAVLIAVGGIVRRNEMAKDPHQNIREVLEEIIDLRLKHRVREDLADVFGEVLVQVKADAPIKREELSTLNRGRKQQVHRVRYAGKLMYREERDAIIAKEAGEAPGAAV